MKAGEIIKQNREKKNLTIKELAYILHTNARVIKDIECSKRYLKIQDLTLLAKIFDIDVNSLITDKEISKMSVGEKLRHYRIKSGLSQRELADKIGLDSTYISSFERNIRKIKDEHLTKICKVLNIEEKLFSPLNPTASVDSENDSIGSIIHSYRKQQKISVLKLNEITGISTRRIKAIEKDELIPYISEIDIFEKLFNIQGLLNYVSPKIEEFDLSKLIAYYRKGTGLKQADLAKKTGLYQTTISEIERGVYTPTSETVKKICTALDIEQSLYENYI